GLQAAVELMESGGGLQSPGGTVSLLCKASGFTFGDYDVWVWQALGKGLESVAVINSAGSTTRYSASVQGRCSLSRDNSQASLSLQLSSLQEADSGTHYCARSAY
ncbi:HV348 protein, partial [Ramphastos sulfuratus]|nr:HV348 protein [Ramphastos sulfuratus]